MKLTLLVTSDVRYWSLRAQNIQKRICSAMAMMTNLRSALEIAESVAVLLVYFSTRAMVAMLIAIDTIIANILLFLRFKAIWRTTSKIGVSNLV